MEPRSETERHEQQLDKLDKPLEPTPSHNDGTVLSFDGVPDDMAANLKVVDDTIEAIGFGKFQWQLALTCGFGFLADQVLLVSVSLVTPQAAMEFGPKYPTLLPAALYAGLLLGAVVLGGLADNFGRRLVWQLSIFSISVVTMVSAAAPNWAGLNCFVALMGFFGGGNCKHSATSNYPCLSTNMDLQVAIDLTILAESIPKRWGFVLSGQAAIWGLGNTVTGLFGRLSLTNVLQMGKLADSDIL